MNANEVIIACQRDAGAFRAEEGNRYQMVREEINRNAEEFEELSGGYGVRFPMNKETLVVLVDFIALERLCCAFLDFVIRVDSGSEHVWLELTGGEGVKEFLAAELGFGQDDLIQVVG